MLPKQSFFIFGGAIGDALLGIQLKHALDAAEAHTTLTLISTRGSGFSRQVAEAAGVRYRELPRNRISSWLTVLGFAFTPHATVFLEPFQDAVPQWWTVIVGFATLMPGSVEVRCQSRPQAVPRGTHIVSYSPKTDNLFEMIARVPAVWGASTAAAPKPWLPVPQCAPAEQPYLLFHFFAGSYRRSWPLEKAVPLLGAAREQFPEHEFVLTCAHGEEELAHKMIEGINNARIEISPKAKDLFCLLTNAAVVVGVASGVTHMAAHLDARDVVMCNLSDPCWLPSYNPDVVMLSERANCKCNGDKTGDCGIQVSGGTVYRCLYNIPTERIIDAMKVKAAV